MRFVKKRRIMRETNVDKENLRRTSIKFVYSVHVFTYTLFFKRPLSSFFFLGTFGVFINIIRIFPANYPIGTINLPIN